MAVDEVGEGGIWGTIKNGNNEELEEKIERENKKFQIFDRFSN